MTQTIADSASILCKIPVNVNVNKGKWLASTYWRKKVLNSRKTSCFFSCLLWNTSTIYQRNKWLKSAQRIQNIYTVWSEGFLYKVALLELKISPIMYFVIHNSVVLSKILKIVVPLEQNFEKTDFYSIKLVVLIIIDILRQIGVKMAQRFSIFWITPLNCGWQNT